MSEITLNSLPKTLDELKAMPQAALTVPEEVAALTVAALALYPENPAETEKMLSCTFPEIQHCSLHKPSKENPIVTLRQFFQFLHKEIRITGAGRCKSWTTFFTNKFEKKQKISPTRLSVGIEPI